MIKEDRKKFKAFILKVAERLQIPVLEAIQPVKKKRHSEFIKVLAKTSFAMGAMLAISPLIIEVPHPVLLSGLLAGAAGFFNYRSWSKYNDLVVYEKFVMNLNYGVSHELNEFIQNYEHKLTPEELQELFSLSATTKEVKGIFDAINDHRILTYNDILYVDDYEDMLGIYDDSEEDESIQIKTALVNYSKDMMASIEPDIKKQVQYFNAKKHL